MIPTSQLLASAVLLVPAWLQAPTPAPPAPPAPQEPAALLTPLVSEGEALPLVPRVSGRARTVAVLAERLEDAAARPGTKLLLEPFAGETWHLSSVRAESAFGGGAVYSAKVVDREDSERGHATLSVLSGSVAGSVRIDARLLRIEPAGGGAHRVVEMDESAFPTCATDASVHRVDAPLPGQDPSGGGGAPKAATNLPTVDVLVVYTTAAKNAQGGANAMTALINLAVAETNQAYLNSDVLQRLRLVHLAELTGYAENGDFNTELNRLTNPGDGWIDNVHALRDQYGADEVSMILASTQYCGIAWLMGNPSHNFQSSAFNAVSRTCTTGYYSFAHELGHNMGSHHDLANAGGTPSFPYSYGWRTANGLWRTILAYAPGTRIQYFSNPNKTFSGQVLGLLNQAENWKSLNNTADTVAQWRCAVPVAYGSAKVTSAFTLPRISWSGKPLANGTGNFSVRIENAIPGNTALVFYGCVTRHTPFLGGTLWVGPPVTRLPAQVLDGAGNASFPFPITLFSPGDEIYCQGWFRDPAHPDGTGSGLTEGLRVDTCQFQP